MMDCLCVAKVNINAIGHRNTNLNSCGFCGGTGKIPTESRKRVSYIMMNPAPLTRSLSYLNIKIGGGDIPQPSCTPISPEIIYNPHWDDIEHPDVSRPITGKYRINGGEWITYTYDDDTANSIPPKDFLESISLPDGRKAIVLDGNGGWWNDELGENLPTPFNSYRGMVTLYGASSSEPFTQSQLEAVSLQQTTIEFEVVNENANDLVFLLFGGSVTAKSCALAFWEAM